LAARRPSRSSPASNAGDQAGSGADPAAGPADAVVVVSAPSDVQRARVLSRDGMTTGRLDALLARQMSDAEKRERAHFVVDSSRSFDSARAQVHGILRAVAALPGRRIG